MSDPTTAAIAGNIGSVVAFGMGIEDAEWLASAMAKHPGQLQPADLANLPRYTAYARLLVDGIPTDPFPITAPLPPALADDRSEIVARASRRRHAQLAGPVLARLSRELAPGTTEELTRVRRRKGDFTAVA